MVDCTKKHSMSEKRSPIPSLAALVNVRGGTSRFLRHAARYMTERSRWHRGLFRTSVTVNDAASRLIFEIFTLG